MSARSGKYVMEGMIFAGLVWNSAYGFLIKDADNIYYSTKNLVRRLCVGGNTVILLWNEPKNKMTISRPTHNPLTFGTVIDIVSTFYHTKNQVGGRA